MVYQRITDHFLLTLFLYNMFVLYFSFSTPFDINDVHHKKLCVRKCGCVCVCVACMLVCEMMQDRCKLTVSSAVNLSANFSKILTARQKALDTHIRACTRTHTTSNTVLIMWVFHQCKQSSLLPHVKCHRPKCQSLFLTSHKR